jgi:glycosyltransferase involved in cell wall biosynthesis
VSAVHQLLPSVAPHDAITSHVFHVQRLMQDLGLESEVFAADVHPALQRTVRPLLDYDAVGDGAVLLYHASIGSHVAGYVRRRRETVVVDYHNITPAGLVRPWEPAIAEQLARGRRELAALADRSVLGLADSRFNCDELDALGFGPTEVAPILFDAAALDHPADPVLAERLHDDKRHGGADWLFVGRVSPHKGQHDLIKAFVVYRESFDPRARLRIVGRPLSARYEDALMRLARRLGVGDAVDFAGGVSESGLAAYFEQADVFVCCSRHEGFCVPLLEAMHHDVPIVAVRAGAVEETLGPAGLVLPAAVPGLVAAAVDRVVRDPEVRDALVRAGRERLGSFDLGRARTRFVDAMQPVLGSS